MSRVKPERRNNAHGGPALIYNNRNLSLVVHLRARHNVSRNLIVVDVARAPVLMLFSEGVVDLHNEEELRTMYKKDEKLFHSIIHGEENIQENVERFVDRLQNLADRYDYCVESHP